jgi:diguanylate cyclase (GGDEF)-like protein
MLIDLLKDYSGEIAVWEFAVIILLVFILFLSRKNRILKTLTSTDALTGLYNYEYFKMKLKRKLSRLEYTHKREANIGENLQVLFFDLDRFKIVNDELGHDAADDILINISGTLEDNLRPSDIIARRSGDEFIVILEEPGEESAIRTAKRIRSQIKLGEFNKDGSKLRIGHYTDVSIGISLFKEGSTSEQMIADAEKAMYEAKKKPQKVITYKEMATT